MGHREDRSGKRISVEKNSLIIMKDGKISLRDLARLACGTPVQTLKGR
jgi:hypothetical protein